MISAVATIDNDPALAGLNLEQVDGKSRTDRVYHQMRDRLMRGIFKPHQRLRISELSQASLSFLFLYISAPNPESRRLWDVFHQTIDLL